MADTVIIDYGAGNLRSVARAVAHAGYDAEIRSDPAGHRGCAGAHRARRRRGRRHHGEPA